jgi:hypothetical protein
VPDELPRFHCVRSSGKESLNCPLCSSVRERNWKEGRKEESRKGGGATLHYCAEENVTISERALVNIQCMDQCCHAIQSFVFLAVPTSASFRCMLLSIVLIFDLRCKSDRHLPPSPPSSHGGMAYLAAALARDDSECQIRLCLMQQHPACGSSIHARCCSTWLMVWKPV